MQVLSPKHRHIISVHEGQQVPLLDHPRRDRDHGHVQVTEHETPLPSVVRQTELAKIREVYVMIFLMVQAYSVVQVHDFVLFEER